MTEQPSTEMTAMSHETTGFCFCGQMHGRVKDWNEHDWAALRTHAPAGALSAQPVSLPTRDKVAAVVKRAGDAWTGPSMDEFRDDPPTRRHYAIADAVRALLSELTPTAEPEADLAEVFRQGWVAGHDAPHIPGVRSDSAEPPRIEDMAPVATHSSGEHRRVRLGEGDHLPVCDTCTNVLGLNVRWDHAILRPDHDPSTIRDVTPPAVR